MVNFKMLHSNMPSLQFLCLDSIITNFQTFYFAFTTSKDPRLQRNLEFLQRRVSNELACELLQDTDAYFDFLFNEHLTIVDCRWLYCSRYWESIDDIFSRIPNLLRIRIEIDTDEILESISKFCPRIIEIDAHDSDLDLTDEGIKFLCDLKNGELPCPELKNVVVLHSSVSEEGVECLFRSLSSIEKFAYEYLPYVLHSIYTKSVSQHQKVPSFNLTELDLRYTMDYRKYLPNFTEVLKACLTVCPKLESIAWVPITNNQQLDIHQQLDPIIYSQLRLKKLDLDFPPTTVINIDNLLKAGGHNLTFLSITRCSVSASVLAVHCPALREFVAKSVDFTDDDLNFFFPSLSSCLLSGNSTVTKAFRMISSSSPKLQSVALFCSDPADKLIEMKNQILKWCKNPYAKRIKFRQAFIEINFLNDIFLNCDSLEWMDLWYCIFDVPNPDEILKCLAKKHPRPIIDLLDDDYRTFINQRCHFSANHQVSKYFCF